VKREDRRRARCCRRAGLLALSVELPVFGNPPVQFGNAAAQTRNFQSGSLFVEPGPMATERIHIWNGQSQSPAGAIEVEANRRISVEHPTMGASTRRSAVAEFHGSGEICIERRLALVCQHDSQRSRIGWIGLLADQFLVEQIPHPANARSLGHAGELG
jgi:hypothetical protein